MSKVNLLKRIEKVEGELWDYYNLIGTKKSNDLFDEEREHLRAHLEGLGEAIHDLQNDIDSNEEFDAEGWEFHIRKEEECLRQVGAFYWSTIKSPRPKYIYV